ncbi:918_t:CDS:2, partial [Acaulospora morrowiae]
LLVEIKLRTTGLLSIVVPVKNFTEKEIYQARISQFICEISSKACAQSDIMREIGWNLYIQKVDLYQIPCARCVSNFVFHRMINPSRGKENSDPYTVSQYLRITFHPSGIFDDQEEFRDLGNLKLWEADFLKANEESPVRLLEYQ